MLTIKSIFTRYHLNVWTLVKIIQYSNDIVLGQLTARQLGADVDIVLIRFDRNWFE